MSLCKQIPRRPQAGISFWMCNATRLRQVMLSLTYALWGLLFGFVLSAPVGPINIICMRRAIFGRAQDGFYIGLGAAVGDAFYAALAAFGLDAAFKFIQSYETILMIAGSVIMLVFAFRIWRGKPRLGAAPLQGKVKRSAAASLVLTLTNPGVFLGFLALYTVAGIGDLGAGDARAYIDAGALTLGVFLGAAFWWFILVVTTRAFRGRFNDDILVTINQVSAALIGLFALGTLGTALLSL